MDVWTSAGEGALFFSEENPLSKSGTFYNATLDNHLCFLLLFLLLHSVRRLFHILIAINKNLITW